PGQDEDPPSRAADSRDPLHRGLPVPAESRSTSIQPGDNPCRPGPGSRIAEVTTLPAQGTRVLHRPPTFINLTRMWVGREEEAILAAPGIVFVGPALPAGHPAVCDRRARSPTPQRSRAAERALLKTDCRRSA